MSKKIKKIPQRKCIVCGKNFDKKDLIRIVKDKSDKIFVDDTFKANGRGYYVCKDTQCRFKLKKDKLLNKAMKKDIPEDIYDFIVDMESNVDE